MFCVQKSCSTSIFVVVFIQIAGSDLGFEKVFNMIFFSFQFIRLSNYIKLAIAISMLKLEFHMLQVSSSRLHRNKKLILVFWKYFSWDFLSTRCLSSEYQHLRCNLLFSFVIKCWRFSSDFFSMFPTRVYTWNRKTFKFAWIWFAPNSCNFSKGQPDATHILSNIDSSFDNHVLNIINSSRVSNFTFRLL